MTVSDEKYKARSIRYAPLGEIGRIALRRCGVEAAVLQFISDTGNVIFRADTAAGSFSIRVYPEPLYSAAEIAGELSWLDALRRETNLMVPEPVPTLSGQAVQVIETPAGGPHQIVIFHWLPGEIIGRGVTIDIAEQMGILLARLHNHAAGFQLPQGHLRDDSDWRGMGHLRANMAEVQQERMAGFLTKEQIELCDQAAGKAAESIALADTTQNYGLIHGDLHSHNCLEHQGQLGVIDFDDCQIAPFTLDFAISVSSFDTNPHAEALREAFANGYRSQRPWSDHCTAEIEAFMMERRLRLIRWVSTWPSVDYFPSGPQLIEQGLEHSQRYLMSQ